MNDFKKVVITGSMRSGTTFLANLLNSNQNCVIFRDFMITLFRIPLTLNILNFQQQLTVHEKKIILANFKAEIMFQYLNSIKIDDFNTLNELFDFVLNSLSNQNTELAGVKITQMVEQIDHLLEETDIYILFIIRDLRDVLLSAYNRFVNYNRYVQAKDWSKGVRKALNINHERFKYIKYEDLIYFPEKTINELSLFFNIKLDTKITILKDLETENWNDNSAFHDVTKLFDKKAVFRWKKRKDSPEVKYSLANYKNLLKELDYEIIPLTLKDKIKYKFFYVKTSLIRSIVILYKKYLM